MKTFEAHRWFFWASIPFLIVQTIISLLWHTPSVSIPIHDTYYVFSQSKFLLALFVFLNFLAIIYWSMLKMERQLHIGLSKTHFIITVLSILILIFGMVISGFFTVSDSSNVKEVLFDFVKLKKIIEVSAFLLLFGQILFAINCISNIIKLR